jgi:hypothetical protein
MAESKSAALPLGDAPMPLFIPGCRLRRPDHNARRDKPQPRLAGSTKITTGGQRPAASSASGAPRKRPGGEQRVAAPHQGEINATSDIRCVEISLAGLLGRSTPQFTTPVNPHGLRITRVLPPRHGHRLHRASGGLIWRTCGIKIALIVSEAILPRDRGKLPNRHAASLLPLVFVVIRSVSPVRRKKCSALQASFARHWKSSNATAFRYLKKM